MDECAFEVCVTGGADGADRFWETVATNKHHKVVIMSFHGHQIALSHVNSHIVQLTQEELNRAESSLQLANSHLKRANYKLNLLRRNYYQIKYSSFLYAVSYVDSSKIGGTSVAVEGGTAWACQMFLLNYIDMIQKPRGAAVAIPMYLYDMKSRGWYRGYASFDNESKFCQFQWRAMDCCRPPAPFGVYTGIGSRKITPDGRGAIEQSYNAA